MLWDALITQCLGRRQKLSRKNGVCTTTGREDILPLPTANIQLYGQTDELSINPGPPTPPSTPVEEVQLPPASYTNPDSLPNDVIIGTFYRDTNTVSFERSYESPSSGLVGFGATVRVDDCVLRDHGRVPSFANEDIEVMFHFTNFKVWEVRVSVPYSLARSWFPKLPSLPEQVFYST